MDLGKTIKELREKKNLTQEDLGLAVGAKKPRQWGSQIENGKIKNLKREHATKLALLLGVDPIHFYSPPEEVTDNILINPSYFGSDPLKEKGSKKELIHQLTDENRILLRENTYLKSILLQHKIDVYNIENQKDTH